MSAMPKQTDFTNWVTEQLTPLGAVRVRSMFGAFGVYVDDLFFAIIDDDVLYFKTDDMNREHFVKAGSEPFRYPAKDGSMTEMSYYSAPDIAMDDQAELLDWARSGLDAALRARAVKLNKGKTSR
ncbi:MAG TPA: TfoX/Sxy family protein [Rhodospirillaceae bacterium]|nr:TfoX/Sxy family protein [Rhodospirillaceae bacterium]